MGRRYIGTRRSAARAWRLMLLLALAGMALSSLGGAIVSGQEAPPITLEEEEQADQPAVETAEPAATQPPETGEATEPAVAPTEGSPGEQVNQPPVGRESEEPPFFLQLVKRVCPAKDGFIPESAPYAELDDACQLEVADPASFFFIVTDATGEQHVANDVAPFFELPVGRTRAAEKHAGGYGGPIVFCSFGKGEPPVRMEVVNREVAFDPKPDTLVTCEFFNPELPPAPLASLTIHKRACAEGYDLGSEKADPIIDCTEPVIKVPFALADTDPATPDQQQATGAVIESGVVFEGLAGGRYTVTETPPEGVTGAVVWTCEVDGRSVDGDGPPLAEGFALELEIPAGADVVCFWFNLRGGEPGAAGDGSITVVKRACPAGYDVTSEKSDPLVDCTKPMDDVGFALMPADPDVDPRKGRTGEDRRGTVTFEGLPAGSYTIEERLPEGVASAFVWACTEDPRGAAAFDGPLAEGTRLEVDLAAGQDLWCLWLNVMDERPVEPTPETTPTPEPTETGSEPGGENTVTIYKWQCPDGADHEQAPDWYVLTCTTEMLNVPFTVTTANGASVEVSQANGTWFGELPDGPLSVREDIPVDYGAPRVFCDPVDAATLTELPVMDGAVSFPVGDGGAEDIICHWYNIPEPSEAAEPLPTESTFVLEPNAPGGTAAATEASVIVVGGNEPGGVSTETEASIPVDDPDGPATVGTAAPGEGNTVTVRKWECPAGSAYGQSQAWYIERCVEPMAGVTFTLTEFEAVDGNGVSARVTEGGTARWTDVSAGNFRLRETIPEGYGEPVMYCQSTVFGSTAWNPLGGGGVTWGMPDDVEEPFSFDCDWYNIPLPGESGEPEPTMPMPWTPTPGAEPAAEPGETAGDAEALAGSGRVRATVYLCPPGTTYDALAELAGIQPAGAGGLCQPMVGEPIILRHANASGTGTVDRSRATDSNGGVFWTDGVPQGSWTLVRAPWAGEEGNPLVMCRYVDPPQGVDAGWRVASDVPGGVYEDAFPETDMLAECHWYIIPTVDPGGANRVRLTVYDCPAGTDAAAIADAWPSGGAGDCARAEGVEVTLAYAGTNGVGDIQRPLVTGASGEAFWSDGVPTAPWSLRRETASGDALVACRYDAVPGAEPAWRFVPVDEGGVFESTFAGVYDHPPEQQADLLDRCHWFTIPAPGEMAEVDSPSPPGPTASPPAGTGSIAVVKVTCPDGFDVDTGDPTRECGKLTDGVSFTVVSSDGATSARGRTGDDRTGTVVFDDLPAGSYEIVEAAQDGTAPVVWACSASIRELAGADGPLAEGGSVTVDLAAGEDVTCLWLNVPVSGESAAVIPSAVVAVPAVPLPPDDPETGDAPVVSPDAPGGMPPPQTVPGGPQVELPVAGEIIVRAYTCTDSFMVPSYQTVYAYRTDCTAPLEVAFYLGQIQDSGGWSFTQRSTGSEGALAWRHLDLGQVSVRQASVRGYAMPHVFCHDLDGSDENWTYMPIDWSETGGYYHIIHEELDAERPHLECEWYNVPLSWLDDDRRVNITRYYCLDPDMTQPLTGQCVIDADRPTVFQTHFDGWDGAPKTLDWTHFYINLSPGGAFTIREELQEGFSPVVARCRIVDYGQRSQTIEDLGWLEASPENSFAFDPIGEDNALKCEWYSIVHSPGRSLTLYTLACPTDTFTAVAGCEAEGGRGFELQVREDGVWRTVTTMVTSRSGSRVTPDLRPGTYRLVPAGGAWCHLATDHQALDDTFTIVSGEDTIVRVYTCGGGRSR